MVGFYGCERYGLPRSLDSYLPAHERAYHQNMIMDCVDGLVLVINLPSEGGGGSGRETTYSSVGNPVLNHWIQLPPLPYKAGLTGLVTRVEDGVVVEYNVVFMDKHQKGEEALLTFDIYSSKIGIWISKQISCPNPRLAYPLIYERSLSLNKKIYWVGVHRRALVAIDFFAADDDDGQPQQCQAIHFPDSIDHHDDETLSSRSIYTISGGSIVYIKKIHLQLTLWRLEEEMSDYSSAGKWQFMQDINLTSFGIDHTYFPLTIHPFETNIIYMATWFDERLASIDLKTHELTRHTKSSAYNIDALLSTYSRITRAWSLSQGFLCTTIHTSTMDGVATFNITPTSLDAYFVFILR